MVRLVRRAVAVGVLVVAAAVPARAQADGTIRAAPSNRYSTGAVTIAPGEKVTFENGDLVLHDVTSEQKKGDGSRLFASEILDGGESGPVMGVPDLQPGEYAFFCSLHESQMKGTLTVSGTPSASPTPGATPTATPAPDRTAPEVTLSGSLRAKPIRRARELTIGLRTNETARVVLRVRVGSRKLGSRAVNLGKGRARLAIALRNVRAIRSGRKLRVIVLATDAAGNRRRSHLVVKLP